MVVVGTIDGTGIDLLQLSLSVSCQFVQLAVLIQQQPFTIGRPIGCLYHVRKLLDHLMRFGLYVIDFQNTHLWIRMLGKCHDWRQQ